ncbi:MAG: nitroreductase family deazaflavin-dependent oxidoreductase [Pseudomonadales bacterium]|nr:nitroreductase family deazaflavin-dependent oxidoreductase [Pseudomonadales bacterium]
MLEMFLLISTISLLCKSWWVFFILGSLFWFGYRPYIRTLDNFKSDKISEEKQAKLLRNYAKFDVFSNWFSGGGHWDYTNLANKPRICFEHYGRKSGKKFVTPALLYNIADRGPSGVSGGIIAASNMGFGKAPQWVYNLRAMQEAGQRITYSFGRSIHVAEIHEITDADVLSAVKEEMVKVYPAFADYVTGAEQAGRELPIFEFRKGAATTGEFSWPCARKNRLAGTGKSDVMRPQTSPFWDKIFSYFGR